jgi:hypothetical protein
MVPQLTPRDATRGPLTLNTFFAEESDVPVRRMSLCVVAVEVKEERLHIVIVTSSCFSERIVGSCFLPIRLRKT